MSQVKRNTGLSVDGLSKAKLKTILYNETKSCTYNKLYTDDSWQGPQGIWDVFNEMDLNWDLTGSEYKNNRDDAAMGIEMPTRKEWTFWIVWTDNKDKIKRLYGTVTAAGAGSVKDPLSKYDLNMVLF